MHVAILTLGTRGDVQPYLALGRALRAAGYEVTLVTGHGFAQQAEAVGLAYRPIAVDFGAMMQTPEAKAALRSFSGAMQALRTARPMIRRSLAETWAASQGADCIVYHPKALAAPHIAEKLNIPAILAMVVPALTPTAAFASPLVPWPDGLAGMNRLSHHVITGALTWPYRGLVNRFRREILALDDMSGPSGSMLTHIRGCPVPRLYGISPTLLPRPADWPATAKMTGAWFLDAAAEWMPPPDLAAFLKDGPPPIFVGFGSMTGSNAGRLTDTVLRALARSGQRGILGRGWGGLQGGNLPPGILMIDDVPYDWLFPRVSAVIHHGGAGTTHEGLRWGRPTLICPVFGDQFFWGRRVAALGAGPEPVRQKDLTVDILAEAMRTLACDQGMAARAQAVGAAIRAETGLEEAVAAIKAATSNVVS